MRWNRWGRRTFGSTEQRVRWGFGGLITVVLITATGALVLGGHDALLSDRPTERLLGVTIAVAGLATAIAVALAWRGRTGLASLGFALGSLPGFLLAAIQTNFDQSPAAARWLLVSIAPAAAAIIMLIYGRPSGDRPSETMLAAVVAAVTTVAVPSVGLLVAAYRPPTDAKVLDIKLGLAVVAERTGPDGSRYAVVDVRADITNTGRQSIVVIGSQQSVVGALSVARAMPSPPKDWMLYDDISDFETSARYEESRSYTLIETAFNFLAPGSVLDPGLHKQQNFLVNVPTGEVDTVRAGVALATAFTDRLSLGIPPPGTPFGDRAGPDDPLTVVNQLKPTSWMARLTRGRPLLKVDYSTEAGEGEYGNTWVDITFGRNRREFDDRPDGSQMEKFYGADIVEASAELAIDGERD
jgi:hypothetical protein